MNTTVSVRLFLILPQSSFLQHLWEAIRKVYLSLDRYGSKKVRNLTLELILWIEVCCDAHQDAAFWMKVYSVLSIMLIKSALETIFIKK